jgi:carbon-monoxide dehydrogenase large subunit
MTLDRPGLVGAPIDRLEDPRFVTGKAEFLDDLVRPGMLHLRLIRSDYASARVRSVRFNADPSPMTDAILFEGSQLTLGIRADVDLDGFQSSSQPVLARRVRFVGEPVAAVLHADPYVAEDAAELVDVDYEPFDAVIDLHQALAPGSPLVHEGWRNNIYFRRRIEYGNIAAARGASQRIIRRRFRTNRQAGVPLEGRGCLAEVDGSGRLTLWSSTQIPHLVRAYLAKELGVAEQRIRVVAPDVGGGFGVKGHVFAEELLVAWLAMRLGRPVKWVEDRREHLMASTHARDHEHVVEAYVTSGGRILGLRAQLIVDAGAYSVYPWTARSDGGMAAKVLPGPYDIRNYEVEDVAVATNKCPLGTYRGVGRPSAVFTMERLIDEISTELGLDPIEVRLQNVVREFPYTTVNGLVYDPGSYAESIEAVRTKLGYDDLRQQQASGRSIGIGLALYNEQTAHGAPDFVVRHVPIQTGYESATVVVDGQGRVTLMTGLQSHGQGLETTLAQVVADELGVPIAHVSVIHGDTAMSPVSVGTWGSRGATLGGGAVKRAARVIKEKMLAIAADALEIHARDLVVEDGRIHAVDRPDRDIAISEIARWANWQTDRLPANMEPGLQSTVFLDGPARGVFSNACHAAVVEVDRATGGIRILRYVVVEDCGTMINPSIVEGQVRGGVAQGLGSALLEEFIYQEDGQPLTTTFMDYLLPTFTDVPTIEINHLSTPSPWTEMGIKGVGEAGAIGPMAALGNAVSDALKRGVFETPLRLERVWRVIEDDPVETGPQDRNDDQSPLKEFWREESSNPVDAKGGAR